MSQKWHMQIVLNKWPDCSPKRLGIESKPATAEPVGLASDREAKVEYGTTAAKVAPSAPFRSHQCIARAQRLPPGYSSWDYWFARRKGCSRDSEGGVTQAGLIESLCMGVCGRFGRVEALVGGQSR
jgi:hypothetical protein